MFGFLRGSNCDRLYRQAYARCCQAQHRNLGVTSLAFLSYEGVFAYVLSIDAGWTPRPEPDGPLCCRLRKAPRRGTVSDDPAARFAAAVGLTLAAVKLEDDVRDRRSWVAHLALWWYRRAFDGVRATLESWRPEITQRLMAAIADHLQLEQSAGPLAIAEYVEPTARAFGELFSVLPTACGRPADSRQSAIRDIGADVGRAIIAFDCAVDWRWDRARGDFNPLPDEDAVEESRRFAVSCLVRAAARCRREFGEAACSARVLEAVNRRVQAVSSVRDWPSCERTQERWGLRRELGFTYAKCDGGCDCGGCDCVGCDCSGCDFSGCGGCEVVHCGDPCVACGGDAGCCPAGVEALPVPGEVIPNPVDGLAPPAAAPHQPLPPLHCGCCDCLQCCDCWQACYGRSAQPKMTKSGQRQVRPEDEQVS